MKIFMNLPYFLAQFVINAKNSKTQQTNFIAFHKKLQKFVDLKTNFNFMEHSLLMKVKILTKDKQCESPTNSTLTTP